MLALDFVLFLFNYRGKLETASYESERKSSLCNNPSLVLSSCSLCLAVFDRKRE